MTISPEAKEAARVIHSACPWPSSEGFIEHHVQLAINSATAPLQKEIERLRGEVEKAFREGATFGLEGLDDQEAQTIADAYYVSRARRVAEGKE